MRATKPMHKRCAEYVSGRFTNANTIPGTPSGAALPTSRDFQLTIIGGFTDGFHFFPVIIRGNVATIYPHHNLLQYNRTYSVEIEPGVLTVSDGSYTGIQGNKGWTFTTKKAPPPANATRIVVSAEGTGDFNTVQGAVDYVPDKNPRRVTIFIRSDTVLPEQDRIPVQVTDKVSAGTVVPTYPVLQYPHASAGGDAISGGFSSHGSAAPRWRDKAGRAAASFRKSLRE